MQLCIKVGYEVFNYSTMELEEKFQKIEEVFNYTVPSKEEKKWIRMLNSKPLDLYHYAMNNKKLRQWITTTFFYRIRNPHEIGIGIIEIGNVDFSLLWQYNDNYRFWLDIELNVRLNLSKFRILFGL